jgi:hypothetical protein
MHVRTHRTRWSVVAGLLATLGLVAASDGAPPQAPQAQSMRINVNQDWQQAQQFFQRRYKMGGYYAQRLGAKLNLQWMSIPGFTFWGARIIQLSPNSPLNQLQLHPGDVITRLDGQKISDGKYWIGQNSSNGYWALPECELHFGHTEVRFIRSGEQQAQNGYVNLGHKQFPTPTPDPIVVP